MQGAVPSARADVKSVLCLLDAWSSALKLGGEMASLAAHSASALTVYLHHPRVDKAFPDLNIQGMGKVAELCIVKPGEEVAFRPGFTH